MEAFGDHQQTADAKVAMRSMRGFNGDAYLQPHSRMALAARSRTFATNASDVTRTNRLRQNALDKLATPPKVTVGGNFGGRSSSQDALL